MTPAAEIVGCAEDRGGDAGRRGRVIVLTGEPASGKSTLCREVVRAAREAGLVVRGIVTGDAPAADGAERWLEDLRNGRRTLLGRTAPPQDVAAGAPRWRLRDAALAWSDAVLGEACPTDLLVVDEVGPLELVQQRGTLPGVRRALAGPYDVALVVVRSGLVARFRQLLPGPPPEVVEARAAGALERLLAAVLAREPA